MGGTTSGSTDLHPEVLEQRKVLVLDEDSAVPYQGQIQRFPVLGPVHAEQRRPGRCRAPDGAFHPHWEVRSRGHVEGHRGVCEREENRYFLRGCNVEIKEPHRIEKLAGPVAEQRCFNGIVFFVVLLWGVGG